MTDICKHDGLLINVLKEEGQIFPFLDAIFGFLYRRTDFYIVKDNPDGKIGFPVGVAERVVWECFKKWQKLAVDSTAEQNDLKSVMEDDMAGLVIHEEEVVTTDDVEDFSVLPTEPIQEKQDRCVNVLKISLVNLIFSHILVYLQIPCNRYQDNSSENFNFIIKIRKHFKIEIKGVLVCTN
ncbi:nudC domain-containing protein 3-like [Homalodisca vitripennis]|uniref:nudC domain-containing protein 3-like n=1 Tax=Homalodisca vitripennis TaxID=197043 RepID=UPI001EEB5805|nr:nudC domain-containing protein 3-like [Homalodisca vitripennis]